MKTGTGMNNTAMELLAPAGDQASLEAAVKGGADAVYLGLNELNARKSAGNFDVEALKRATSYCHDRDRRVYVTVNTMVKQSERALVEHVVDTLSLAGVDAAIVQDLGVARAMNQMNDTLPIHASTQMAIHNIQGMAFARKQGFARVVLARELTFDEIAECAQSGVEVEVFGHGALCVSASGQCLFSSIIGGRSGNRGMCAQPCRLSYSLLSTACEASGCLLSPKDLMTLPMLDKLKQTGATSLKLEGRLKGPDYVYAVTSTYRRALDGEMVDENILRQVFNRGYTRGYGPGVNDGAFLINESQRHVLSQSEPFPDVSQRLRPVTGKLAMHIGQPSRFSLSDGRDVADCVGAVVELAKKTPVDVSRYVSQMEKLGATAYRMTEIKTDIDAEAFLPVSQLNELRRECAETLSAIRVGRRRGCDAGISPIADEDPIVQCAGKPRLCVQSHDAQALLNALSWGAEEIAWAPIDITDAGLDDAPNIPFTLCLPPTLNGADLTRLHDWALNNKNIECVLISNAAHLTMSWATPVRADYPLNIANAWAVEAINMPYTPSVELTAAEIRPLLGDRELIVYGRLMLMQLRFCPLNAKLSGGLHASCRRCDQAQSGIAGAQLIDRKQAFFPLTRIKTTRGCIIRVMSNYPLMLLRKITKLPAAARWRMILTDEDAALAESIVRCYKKAADGEDFKIGSDWAKVDAQPGTTGHYFRGVQ